MTEAFRALVVYGSSAVFAYFALEQALLSGLMWRSRKVIIDRERMPRAKILPGVSILVPAHNEQAWLAQTIASLRALTYPTFEILILNNGSTDETMPKLTSDFDLQPVVSDEDSVRVYRSLRYANVRVADIEKAGKGNALNIGTHLSSFDIVAVVDADVQLGKNAFLFATDWFANDPLVVAVAGTIRPLNGSTFVPGKFVEPEMPRRMLERVQLAEYLGSFLATRPAWAAWNALPIVAGAFGLFKKEVLELVGGFHGDTMAEDLDLTIRIHEYSRENWMEWKVAHSHKATVWTEVPSTLKYLGRQRTRWYQGLVTELWRNRHTLFNRRYGRFGMVSLPYQLIFEAMAPLVAMFGLAILPVAIFLEDLNLRVAWWLFVVSMLFGALNVMMSIMLDRVSEPHTKHWWPIFVSGVLGLVWYRLFKIWWALRGLLRIRNQHWHAMDHTGLS